MNASAQQPDTHAAQWSLCVLRGLHAGARSDGCGSRMLVIGSADDCDMILADAGVAAHHAIATIGATGWALRALEGPLGSEANRTEPGDSIELEWFDVITLGPVALSVGDADSPRWAELIELPEELIEPSAEVQLLNVRRRRRRGLVALVGLAIFTVTAITTAALRSSHTPPPPSQRSLLEDSVRQVALEKSEIAQDTQGNLSVSGLAESEASVDKLREDLAARGVVADVDVRSGKDIARDVGEVLRLSGLPAQTVYRGKGEVGIEGHFGNNKALDDVLGSRALRDVKGLTKVAVVNLDKGQPEAAPVLDDSDARNVIAAVGGIDPYVVTADGSRYFAGAQLPCGGRLRAVDGQQVFVEADGKTGTLACTGAVEMVALGEGALTGPPAPQQTVAINKDSRTSNSSKSKKGAPAKG